MAWWRAGAPTLMLMLILVTPMVSNLVVRAAKLIARAKVMSSIFGALLLDRASSPIVGLKPLIAKISGWSRLLMATPSALFSTASGGGIG